MKEFCEAIEKRKIKIEWICLARADTINDHPEILMTMKNAGCVGLEIGVESLDENVLQFINKKINTTGSMEALKTILESGLEIACLQLMTFNVGETIFGHYIQNKMLTDITGDKKVFFGQFATPYPGSKFGDTAENDGMVLVENWQDYVTSNVNFIPNELLNEKPVRTLKRLRISDSIIIIREMRQLEDLARTTKNHFDILTKIQFFYKYCNGKNSVEDISYRIGKRFNLVNRDALAHTVKIVVIMSQLGLIRPYNMHDYPQNIVPDWQKRFFGFNSNLDMNMYLLSGFFKSRMKS
jgi:radical SAM superfamily enzyme YgiQ (UPF0313 family)